MSEYPTCKDCGKEIDEDCNYGSCECNYCLKCNVLLTADNIGKEEPVYCLGCECGGSSPYAGRQKRAGLPTSDDLRCRLRNSPYFEGLKRMDNGELNGWCFSRTG